MVPFIPAEDVDSAGEVGGLSDSRGSCVSVLEDLSEKPGRLKVWLLGLLPFFSRGLISSGGTMTTFGIKTPLELGRSVLSSSLVITNVGSSEILLNFCFNCSGNSVLPKIRSAYHNNHRFCCC